MPQPKLNKHIPTILALSVVILLSCTTYGQNRNELTVNGFAGYGSNALNNEFMNKLVLGGNISNSLKDQTLNHTNKYNRIGADLTYEVYFKNYSDTLFDNAPNWRLYFGLGSYTQYSSTFTRDLYKTIFYGNKVFGDQEASIGGSQFFLLDFKKITIGFTHIKHKLSIGLSVVSGNNLEQLHLKKGTFKTQNNGASILINTDATYLKSDSLGGGYLSFSGIGSTIDIIKEFKFADVAIKNLGFATWKRNPSYNKVILKDYTFEGFRIDDITDTEDFSFQNTFDTVIQENQSKSFTRLLPFEFLIISKDHFNRKIEPMYGFRSRAFSNYHPYQYIGLTLRPFSHFQVSSAISYGGYTTFEGKLWLSLYGKNYQTSVGTDNLYGLISKNGFGNSVLFSLSVFL